MKPAQETQLFVVKRLDTETDPIYSYMRQPGRICPVHALRIGFQGYFTVGSEPERLSESTHDHADLYKRQQ